MAIWSLALTESRSLNAAPCRASWLTPRSVNPSTSMCFARDETDLPHHGAKLAEDTSPTSRSSAPPAPKPKSKLSQLGLSLGAAGSRRARQIQDWRRDSGRGGVRCGSRKPCGRKKFPPRRCDRGSRRPDGEDARRVSRRSTATLRRARRWSFCWSTAMAI